MTSKKKVEEGVREVERAIKYLPREERRAQAIEMALEYCRINFPNAAPMAFEMGLLLAPALSWKANIVRVCHVCKKQADVAGVPEGWQLISMTMTSGKGHLAFCPDHNVNLFEEIEKRNDQSEV